MRIQWANGPIDAIIFDCDGVLLDTERLYTQVGHDIIAQHSCLEHPHERVITPEFKGMLMGRKKHECSQMMVEQFKLGISVEEHIQLSYAMEEELFRNCCTMPGAIEIVEALAMAGIPLGLASGSSSCTFHIKSQNHSKLFSRFGTLVLGDDPALQQGKPAPDIFLHAAQRLCPEIDADAILVVEDSANGVRAGLAAGMHVAWIPEASFEVEKNYAELAGHPKVLLFDSLAHLQSTLFLS